MKRKHLFTCALLLLAPLVKAQDYYHGIGGQLNYGIFRTIGTEGNSGSLEAAAVPGIVYKATLGFDISRSLSFAVSAYPFLGASGSFNSQSGGNLSIGAELPVLGELYFGEIDDACFIMGAGFSAAFLGSSGYGSGTIIGPQLAIGGQFPVRDRLIGLRVAYTYGMNGKGDLPTGISKSKRSMFNFGFYYLLGQ